MICGHAAHIFQNCPCVFYPSAHHHACWIARRIRASAIQNNTSCIPPKTILAGDPTATAAFLIISLHFLPPCSIEFQLAQDPSSHNLGTTVWDASIVLAKYLEKNVRKGEFSRVKVKGKRCIELGAGMGLAGMAFALLGADVALTDTTDAVMALLRRNVDTNMSQAALKLKDADWAIDVAGKVSVAELDWSNTSHYEALNPPFDYIIAADCVYSEKAVPHFLNCCLAMAAGNLKSTIVVCNEFRSQSVHDIFMAEFSKHMNIKKVPMNKFEAEYQHPLIHIYVMKKLKKKGGIDEEGVLEETGSEIKSSSDCVICDPDKQFEALAGPANDDDEEVIEVTTAEDKIEKKEESERFAARRQGAALAQTLHGIKLDDGSS